MGYRFVPINLRALNGANDFDICDDDQKVLFLNFDYAHKAMRWYKFPADIRQVLSYNNIHFQYRPRDFESGFRLKIIIAFVPYLSSVQIHQVFHCAS